jgi:hypothetical protein
MALNRDTTLNNLTRIVQVIKDDRLLQEWFDGLAHKPEVERRNEIYSTVERMKAEGEDADLVASFQLLADSEIFHAAGVALRGNNKDAG